MDHTRFLQMVRESLHIKHHFDLLMWLQGEFQHCIPHDIFVAAWGDFSLGLIQYDVVSPIPAVRTGKMADQKILPVIQGLYERWIGSKMTPFSCGFRDGITLTDEDPASNAEHEAFRSMRSAVVHGIRDERGRLDCLYAFFNSGTHVASASMEAFRVVLPFVDSALRQVAHLPCQYPQEKAPESVDEIPSECAAPGQESLLSQREIEIMNWVKQGKTNFEIGIILNISTFTVKNHLQRIFRKLDVTNRAQAVDRVGQLENGKA